MASPTRKIRESAKLSEHSIDFVFKWQAEAREALGSIEALLDDEDRCFEAGMVKAAHAIVEDLFRRINGRL